MDRDRLKSLLDSATAHLLTIDTLQDRIDTDPDPALIVAHCQLIHEHSFTARAALDAVRGELGLSDGTARLGPIDKARLAD